MNCLSCGGRTIATIEGHSCCVCGEDFYPEDGRRFHVAKTFKARKRMRFDDEG